MGSKRVPFAVRELVLPPFTQDLKPEPIIKFGIRTKGEITAMRGADLRSGYVGNSRTL